MDRKFVPEMIHKRLADPGRGSVDVQAGDVHLEDGAPVGSLEVGDVLLDLAQVRPPLLGCEGHVDGARVDVEEDDALQDVLRLVGENDCHAASLPHRVLEALHETAGREGDDAALTLRLLQ